MSGVHHLGPLRFTHVAPLAREGNTLWEVVRREPDGARFLLQIWDPRPDDRTLDALKETYLGFWQDAGPLDPGDAQFGFDEGRIWLLQPLPGQPLAKLWLDWTLEQRGAFQRFLGDALGRSPRLLHPAVIGLKPGRVIVPRVLGDAPLGLPQLYDQLGALEGGVRSGGLPLLPWTQPRELGDPCPRPIHGRSQELTYLKSLMLGLMAPAPMERVVVLQGEEGLGKEQLAAWAQASAAIEGFWVHTLEANFEDTPGTFVGRLLQGLLAGTEADLYARRPGVARALARRLDAYAFLSGSKTTPPDLPLEPEEVQATLEALEFARSYHSRLVHLAALDRCSPDLLAALKDLILHSSLPWLISAPTGAQGSKLRPLLGPLQADPAVAMVHLHRLEDDHLRQVAEDLLGPHRLPESFLHELLHQSLGNPGLLQRLLELSQQEGRMAWAEGAWTVVPGREGPLPVASDLVAQILLGRLQRLGPASAALVRLIALADHPIDPADLGRALGLGLDPLEDALLSAVSSRLVRLQEGRAALADPHFRETVIDQTAPAELKRLARSLVATLQDRGGKPLLSVRLQSLASDEKTALQQVMRAIEHEQVSPAEARKIVDQALQLHPEPLQEAQLQEFLADMSLEVGGPVLVPHFQGADHPSHEALEALDKALAAMGRVPEGEPHRAAALARLLRKKALHQAQLRDLPRGLDSVQQALTYLADHPLHPEQPRLRLALGKIQLLQGQFQPALRTLEEGLQLLSMGGVKGQHADQEALLMELGRALAHQSQFQRAISMMQSAQRLLEHDQDARGLVSVAIALGQVFLAHGQPDAAHAMLRDALHRSRSQADLSLQAQAHFALGTLRSVQASLGPALSHLDRALERFHRLGDSTLGTQAKLWRARTLAALGDAVQAEHILLQAISTPRANLTALEQGDQVFLQAEIAAFQSGWRDAARLYHQAAQCFGSAGLVWRERMAGVRRIQAEAQAAPPNPAPETLEDAWSRLEALKGPVEGSGSRWLELEWNRAHALLLSTAGDSEVVAGEALLAYGEVLAAARDLRFPSVVLEASSKVADLLLKRGERFGARSRLQDAFASFQEIWTQVPESFETTFVGRADMHAFRQAVEAAGLRFVLPEKVDPLADWTPTQANLPTVILPDEGAARE